MRLIALTLLLASSALAAQTQNRGATPPPGVSPAWLRVEHLQPGDPIAVLEQRQSSHLISCMMDQANDQSLSCIVDRPYAPPQTFVFPIASVAAVYSEDFTYPTNHIGLYLAGGLGVFLGAGLCAQTNVQIALTCATIGGLVGVSAALHAPPPPPRPRRLQRYLVYKAP